jgi:predicted nucleic acid-binding Zn ribbon protein
VPTCSTCGEPIPDGARFCSGCGAELGAASGREVRKTVTVIFADVTGSTALVEEAIRLYDQKGHVVAAERLRARLAEPSIEI